MNIHEIYNLLFEGKSLELEFSSSQEAEKFRVALAQYKSIKDKQLVGVGLYEKEDLQKLSFKLENQSGNLPLDSLIPEAEPALIATVCFKEKKPAKQFKILRVLDGSDGND